VESKFAVAVHLQGYEFLPKAETAAQISANFPRISGTHDSVPAEKSAPIPGSSNIVVEAPESGQVGNR
jgi:hypothetical protein